MTDAVRRTLRAVFQGIVAAGPTAVTVFTFNGLTPLETAGVLLGWKTVVTFAQNWLEDNTKFPAVLKAEPSSGLNPVTEDPALPSVPLEPVAPSAPPSTTPPAA